MYPSAQKPITFMSVAGLGIGLLISTSAIAATNQGRITLYNIDSRIGGGRGACVRMTPALPTQGWACVYKSNPLYGEINQLLLQGYINQKTCAVAWNTVDREGLAIIFAALCL